MARYCVALLLAIVASLLMQCQNATTENSSIDFRVNPALLDFLVTDSVSGVSVSIPKGLVKDKALLSHSNLNDIQLFMTPDSSFMMSLQQGSVLSASRYREAFAAPDSTLRNGPFDITNKAAFYVNGLEVNQYLMESADLINFKLAVFGEAESVLEINYLVKRNVYEKMMPKIESSIGSLKKK